MTRRRTNLDDSEWRGKTPRCFTEVEWNEWNIQRVHANTRGDACVVSNNYCIDCTPRYRDRMCWAGKCERPNTVFVEKTDCEGVQRVGVHPEHPLYPNAHSKQKIVAGPFKPPIFLSAERHKRGCKTAACETCSKDQ